eukprot:scaffold39283_cov40-Tisochrysis_lutea.AAC.3
MAMHEGDHGSRQQGQARTAAEGQAPTSVHVSLALCTPPSPPTLCVQVPAHVCTCMSRCVCARVCACARVCVLGWGWEGDVCVFVRAHAASHVLSPGHRSVCSPKRQILSGSTAVRPRKKASASRQLSEASW